jgi:hypothetical protein
MSSWWLGKKFLNTMRTGSPRSRRGWDMDGHHSGDHKAATPPQNPRLFLKFYGIFTRLLQHLYNFSPGTCHTPQERFTRAVLPGMAPERPSTPACHTAIWGRKHRGGACEGTNASIRFSSTSHPVVPRAILSVLEHRWLSMNVLLTQGGGVKKRVQERAGMIVVWDE